jgi:hypothetical protein
VGWQNYVNFWTNIRVFRVVRRTQHQKNEFGPKPVEIQNKPAKKYIRIPGQAETQKSTIFFVVN